MLSFGSRCFLMTFGNFIITREWLYDWGTPAGPDGVFRSWTRAQKRLLTGKEKVQSGWVEALLGREISFSLKRQVELAASKRCFIRRFGGFGSPITPQIQELFQKYPIGSKTGSGSPQTV